MADLLHTLRRTFDKNTGAILTELSYDHTSTPKLWDEFEWA